MISTIWERLIFHRISIIVVCRASISAILHTPDFLAFQIWFDSVTSKFHCSTSSLSFGFYDVWTFFNEQGKSQRINQRQSNLPEAREYCSRKICLQHMLSSFTFYILRLRSSGDINDDADGWLQWRLLGVICDDRRRSSNKTRVCCQLNNPMMVHTF